MIRGHSLSSTNLPGYYLSPDNSDVSPVLEYESGGIDLNDISEGLEYQDWQARLEYRAVRRHNGIFLSAPSIEEYLFFDEVGITEFSFTFDQNMNPFFCYMQDGQAKYHWYDPTIPGYDTVSMAVGVTSPKCCLDDKRLMETSTSDIILAYKRAGNLYYREQRDRFGTEYLLKTGITGELLLVGMHKRWRLQFAIGLQDYPDTTFTYRYAKGFRRRIVKGGGARRIPGVNYG
jgi:hypothetical protein